MPPLPEGAEAVYAWSGGGSAGTLRSADGTPAPCETADASATYHAGLAAGSDQVHVTVYRDPGGRRAPQPRPGHAPRPPCGPT